jgi:pseudaminic acid biosynthesis-associated methylase
VTESAEHADADRLEDLWRGQYGDEWSDRNIDMYDSRQPVWDSFMERLAPRRVLEVGCNVGGNLRWIVPHLEPGAAYGVDVNRHALELIHGFVPDANVLVASARDLPFRDGLFDLVFTVGVLIHHPDGALEAAIRELVRCSSRWVLVIEMFAEQDTEIPHRGIRNAILKRDYGHLLEQTAPELTRVDEGYLSVDEGFDSLNWWLFEKR